MMSDFVRRIEGESIALMDAIDQDPLIATLIHGNASREAYVRFLAATYHYLRWSGPLLAETAEGLRRSGRCPLLVGVLEAKTNEESPHDAWVLDDLRALGVKAEIVKATAVPNAVQAYVQWSLTLAYEGSPAYLGAAYALEFISTRRAKMAADNLRAHRAIPAIDNAVSFLAGHGEADADHVALLNDILGKVDAACDQDSIVLSAAVMRVLYPRFFRSEATRSICDSFAA